MSAKPLSGARITARVLFVVTFVFLVVGVALFVSPVDATATSSAGDETVACGAVAASNLFQLRYDAQQQTQENDASSLANAVAQLRDETPAPDAYVKYDACQQAIDARKPWVWVALGLMVLALMMAITIRVSARAN